MEDDKFVIGKRTKRALVTLGIIIALFVLMYLIQLTNALSAIAVVLTSLQALLFGILFACLLDPLVRALESGIGKGLSKFGKPRKELSRFIAVIISMGIMIFAIVAILFLIIPQIGITLTKIIPQFREMINGFNDWVAGLSTAALWQERVAPGISEFTNNIANWLLGNIGVGTDMYNTLTSGIVLAVGLVINFLVGLIMAIYMLISKEKLFAQMNKLNKALFKEKWGGFASESIEEAARIFSGFFGAKILEAILMGVITFVVMVIFRWPYGTLISVMVGAANIIPFFGPYIGAVLGAAVIVLVDPWQALGFIIFQIILVQVDANFFGPRILGHKTGLTAFWVIVSILFFTGCFGIVGAFIGVPVFAWIYYIVKKITETSLRKQGLPTETSEYGMLNEKNKDITFE